MNEFEVIFDKSLATIQVKGILFLFNKINETLLTKTIIILFLFLITFYQIPGYYPFLMTNYFEIRNLF